MYPPTGGSTIDDGVARPMACRDVLGQIVKIQNCEHHQEP